MTDSQTPSRRSGSQSLLAMAPDHVEPAPSPAPSDDAIRRAEAERAELRSRAAAIKHSLDQARQEAAEMAERAERAAELRRREHRARIRADVRSADAARDRHRMEEETRHAAPPSADRIGRPETDERVESEPSSSSDRDDGYWRPLIDPLAVISGVWNSKRIILATSVAGALIGVALALATPKKYDAYTELLFDPRNLNIVERELTQSGLPSDATLALVENQVQVITSGNVIGKVVDRLKLTEDPEFNGEGKGGIIGTLSNWRALFQATDGLPSEARIRSVTAGNLYDSLSVERGLKTFVITISAVTEDPEKSALIANTVVEVFLQTYGEIQSGTAGRATSELTSRLGELQKGVEAAERKVEDYKAQKDIINPQGRLITDDEIVKLNDQLTVARARTIELNAKAQSARDIDVSDALGGTLPEQVTSSVMTELRSQYASLKQELDRLGVRLGPRHPQLAAVEAQLVGARAQIQSELRRIVSSIQVELQRAVQLEQDMASRLAQLKARQASVGSELVQLRELEREAQAARAVYESYLLRARETGEQQSLNTANMSVISPAFPPLLPTGPSRSAIAMVGLVLGFGAGIAIGILRGAIGSLRQSGMLPGGNSPAGGRRFRRRENGRDQAPVPAARTVASPPRPTEPIIAASGRFAPPPPPAVPPRVDDHGHGDDGGHRDEGGHGDEDHATMMRRLRETFRNHGVTGHEVGRPTPDAQAWDEPDDEGLTDREVELLQQNVAALRRILHRLEDERREESAA